MFNHCDYVSPIMDLTFINPSTKRTITLKATEILWIYSTSIDHSFGFVSFARKNMAMGTGWNFTMDDFCKFFYKISLAEI